MRDLNKKILVAAVTVLSIGVVGNVMKNTVFAETKSTERTFEIDNISNIYVKENNQKIVVEGSDTDNIKVIFEDTTSKYQLNTEVHSDTLSIDVNRKNLFSRMFQIPDFQNIFSGDDWFEMGEPIVTVYVPNNQFDEINVEVDNGMIVAEDIHAKNIVAKTDNGRIEMEGVTSEELNLSTSNGRIKAEDITGDITAKTDNGVIDVKIDNLDRNLKLETNNGKINVEVEKEPTSVLFDVDVENGHVNILDNKYEDDDIIGDGDNLVSASVDNGSITIEQE